MLLIKFKFSYYHWGVSNRDQSVKMGSHQIITLYVVLSCAECKQRFSDEKDFAFHQQVGWKYQNSIFLGKNYFFEKEILFPKPFYSEN